MGTVQTKVQSLATAHCLFDICSTDSWVLTSFAEQIKAPECGQFDGLVRTITGPKRCIMPKFQIKIEKDDGQWINITAIGCTNIGYKPAIDMVRFRRLTSAFNIPAHQIENSSGPIQLLLGLKQQSLQAYHVGEFTSSRFPNVGIYTSSILINKFIFVGSNDETDEGGSVSFRA